MRIFRDLSIRYKVTLLLLGVVSIVMLVVSVANVINEVQTTRAAMAVKYATLAQIVASQSAAALSIADIDASGAQQIVSELDAVPNIRFAALYNAKGDEVARYPADLPDQARPSAPRTLGATLTSDGFLDVVQEVELNDGGVVGRIFLRASTEELQTQIRRTVQIAIFVYIIALMVASLLSIALQRFTSTPILQLADIMRRVSEEHDYTLCAEKRSNDELGELCNGFNRMLAVIRRRDSELARHRSYLEEEVQQRTQALQAANKELEAFSYSVSHDLRAPLRAIDGFSRILLSDYAAALPEDAQEYLRDVRGNTQQMGRLVDDLLAFSRLSRQAVKRQPVQPRQIVRECLEELRGEYEGRRVELRVGELFPCSGDPILLKQVWTNLLSNAIKYTARKDVAVIEVGNDEVDTPGVMGYFVKDNGVGFDMHYADKLFEVFQRLHRAEDYAGTGVGLAIVQRIVHRHGGTIWAESQPDHGATFHFSLPIEDAQDDC